MLLWCEVTGPQSQIANEQEDGTDNHVEAMETRSHKEVRAIDIAGEAKGRVAVLIGLKPREQDAQQNSDDQPIGHVLAVILMRNGVVRPCRSRTGAQQDQRVDQRQMPRIKGLDTSRRPDTIYSRADPIGVHRVHGVLEEAPEPSRKEHDFGHDEQDEAIAKAKAHNRGVIANAAFGHNFRPPGIHDVKNDRQANEEHERCDGMHPKDGPKQHGKAAQCSQERQN